MTKSKRITVCLAVIAIGLIAALALLPGFVPGSGGGVAGAETIYRATYRNNSGKLGEGSVTDSKGRKHLSQAEATAKENGKAVTWITDAAQLKNFLETSDGNNAGAIGYLGADIDYNWQNLGAVNSTADFCGTFDGNGYSVTITARSGDGVFRDSLSTPISTAVGETTQIYDRHFAPSSGSGMTIWEFGGFFVGINRGTIRNTDFVFKSNMTGDSWTDTYSTDAHWGVSNPRGRYRFTYGGAIAGITWGGKLLNCNLDMQGALVLYKNGEDHLTVGSGFNQHSAGVGGFTGVLAHDSVMEGCSINLGEGTSVTVMTHGNLWDANSTRYTLTVAGGMIASIGCDILYETVDGVKRVVYEDKSTVKNCAISGTGKVQSFAGGARTANRREAFVGAAIGGSIFVQGSENIGWREFNSGTVDGLISDFTGPVVYNYHREPADQIREYGKLFGMAGNDPGSNTSTVPADAITGVVLTYNYTAFTAQQGVPSNYLDCINYNTDVKTKALCIYPASDGGRVSVGFQDDMIRVQALSDGFKTYDMTTGAESDDNAPLREAEFTTQWLMTHNEGVRTIENYGRFIWKSEMVKNGVTAKAHITAYDNVGAEVYMMTKFDAGSLFYEFGERLDYTLQDTNSSSSLLNRPYNGETLNAPLLKLVSVLGNTYAAEPTKFAYEIIKDSTTQVNASSTFLPGAYTYTPILNLEGKYRFAYYDDALKIAAPYDTAKTKSYTFSVQKAKLDVDAPAADIWLKSAPFAMTIGGDTQGGLFDNIRFQRDADAMSQYIATGGAAPYYYTATASSGYNGSAYKFYAYRTIGQTNVLVAESDVYTVKIDGTAPVIKDVKYYDYANGVKGAEFTEAEFNRWRRSAVLIEYTVSDEGRSGVDGANHGNSGATTVSVDENGDWHEQLIISSSGSVSVQYTDAKSNAVTRVFTVKIDSTVPKLTVASPSQQKFSPTDYTYPGTEVRYSVVPGGLLHNATYGSSGYKLYIGYGATEDPAGAGNWQEVALGASAMAATIPLNWDMAPTYLFLKLENEQGLYDPIVICAKTSAGGNEGRWSFIFIQADIDLTLDDILYDGAALSSYDAATLGTLLGKAYDGTADMDVSKLSLQIPQNAIKWRPAWINGDNGAEKRITPTAEMFAFSGAYDAAAAGDRALGLQVAGITANGVDYASKFRVTIAGDEIHNFAVAISRAKVELDLFGYGVKKEYTYGDEIPTHFDYTATDGTVNRFVLTTRAVTGASQGSYIVTAALAAENPNYDFTIANQSGSTSTNYIVINKKVVSATPYLNGEADFSSTVKFVGKSYVMTATYTDIKGATVKADVRYYANADRNQLLNIDAMKDGRTYYIRISTADENYLIENADEYTFSIIKAYLPIETGVRVTDYCGNYVSYDPKINLDDMSQFDPAKLVLTYYPTMEGASYNPVTGEVTATELSTPIDASEVIEVGIYKVKIAYNATADDIFYSFTGKEGWLVVTKADVVFEATEYAEVYDGGNYSYDLVKGKVVMKGKNKHNEITTEATVGDFIQVQMYDTTVRQWLPVTDVFGQNKKAGVYTYRLNFAGDEHYNANFLDVRLTISKAKFVGVTFEDNAFDYLPKAQRSIAVNLPDQYRQAGAKVTYMSGLKSQAQPFKFTDAGAYLIAAIVSLENYEDLRLEATLTIKAIALPDTIVPINVMEAVYDGKVHSAGINGLVYDAETKTYYLGTVQAMVIFDDKTKGTDVGSYNGTITVIVPNYQTKVIPTHVNIVPAPVTNGELNFKAEDLTADYNFANAVAVYTGADGNQYGAPLAFFDADGKKVVPDENGKLPAGTYTVEMELNNNYTTTQSWSITIVDPAAQPDPGPTKPKTNVGAIVGGAVGGVGGVGVITTVVVLVLKKRKKSIL